jgi:hypothetical protein
VIRSIFLLSYSSVVCFIFMSVSGILAGVNYNFVSHTFLSIIFMFLVLASESFIIFYFIETGKQIKETIGTRKDSAEILFQTNGFKKRLYPFIVINILLFILTFGTGGGVTSGRLPYYLHIISAAVFGIAFLRSLPLRKKILLENVLLIKSIIHMNT